MLRAIQFSRSKKLLKFLLFYSNEKQVKLPFIEDMICLIKPQMQCGFEYRTQITGDIWLTDFLPVEHKYWNTVFMTGHFPPYFHMGIRWLLFVMEQVIISVSQIKWMIIDIHTMLYPIKIYSNTIELSVHTSCFCILDLLCVNMLALMGFFYIMHSTTKAYIIYWMWFFVVDEKNMQNYYYKCYSINWIFPIIVPSPKKMSNTFG